jgi:hypothetical protein
MPPTTDPNAEQEVTRQLHEWNNSAFGSLFDYLDERLDFPLAHTPHRTHVATRCNVEQK